MWDRRTVVRRERGRDVAVCEDIVQDMYRIMR